MRCRVCNALLQNRILKLSEMPLTDDFVPATHIMKPEYLSDISIYRCDSCNVVQNPSDFSHEDYYKEYRYTSGHSEFVREFMALYAETIVDTFKQANHRLPASVLEIGSGDGEQLIRFKELGIGIISGVEPSSILAETAIKRSISTTVALFGLDVAKNLPAKYDLCISSYTFDHVRNPVDYLASAYHCLNDNGILALEVHDYNSIVRRTEFCLFEHEHTIYLDEFTAESLLSANGFKLLAVNPLPSAKTRGNSLILIAIKQINSVDHPHRRPETLLNDHLLSQRISKTIQSIDQYVDSLSPDQPIVGFGAGGRGVMTLAAMRTHSRFAALLDSAFSGENLLAPKTRIPIIGPDKWKSYNTANVLVFSYGYIGEISHSLSVHGFEPTRIKSLLDFYQQDAANS